MSKKSKKKQTELEPTPEVQNSESESGSVENVEEIDKQNKLDQKQTSNGDLESHRSDALEKLMEHNGIRSGEPGQHNEWFQNAYEMANNDPASIPWADMKPSKEIVNWLNENPGEESPAVEIGCGLGDNAEAMAAAGWKTTAFDISEAAINWAKSRFPETPVSYLIADLLDLPQEMLNKFDLVVDSHNLQAFVPGSLRPQAIESLISLMSANGQLLIASLYGFETDLESGPPWPLTNRELEHFKNQGLVMNMLRPSITRMGDRMKAQILVGFIKKIDP